ncbi:hypothetical protein D556_1610 [Bordetella holmesii 41130]|nr:hypothetical protein D556_1610 [Bordetella holmesii 41130]
MVIVLMVVVACTGRDVIDYDAAHGGLLPADPPIPVQGDRRYICIDGNSFLKQRGGRA